MYCNVGEVKFMTGWNFKYEARCQNKKVMNVF